MSEMVDRVAAAIATEIEKRSSPETIARGAIAAMRESTVEMQEECWDVSAESDGNGGGWINSKAASELWSLMIDRSLKSK